MDIDQRLRAWADQARVDAEEPAARFGGWGDGVPTIRRSRHSRVLVAASVILMLCLAAGLAVAVHSDRSPHQHIAGAPPTDPSRLVECGPIQFHARQLSGPTIDLSQSPEPDVVALRHAVASQSDALVAVPGGYGGRHWYAIRPNQSTTLFLTHLRAMSYAGVVFTRKVHGWKPTASFGCVPSRVFAHHSPGKITGAAPSPLSDRTLLLQSTPAGGPCGTSVTAAQFHVVYGRSWIAITATYPLPPSSKPYICPLPVTPTFALKLDRPIGNRRIYDDGFLRPIRITHSADTNRSTDSPIPRTPVN